MLTFTESQNDDGADGDEPENEVGGILIRQPHTHTHINRQTDRVKGCVRGLKCENGRKTARGKCEMLSSVTSNRIRGQQERQTEPVVAVFLIAID